ncbi:MAG: hypothetical protein ACC645_12035 [Pirellulales bacterium]
MMRRLKSIFLGAAVVTATLLPTSPTLAIPPFWKQFEAKYVTDNANKQAAETLKAARCTVCHIKGQKKKVRNPYGAALSKLLDKKNFAKERIKAEPEKVKQEIVAALDKVASIKADAANDKSPTFGERIAGGKLPASPAGGKKEEKTPEEKKPAKKVEAKAAGEKDAAPAEQKRAVQAKASPGDQIAELISQLATERQQALKAQLRMELSAEIRSEIIPELRAQLRQSLAPQIKARILREMNPPSPEAEQQAITKIEEIGGTVRPIALNDDSQEVDFHLGGTKLDDAGLALVKDLRKVIHLNLKETQITDAGLAHLGTIPSITRLHLEKTKITDEGLTQLSSLGELEYLNLYGTSITDAGLVHLQGLDRLKKLYLWQTGVTDEGVRRLQDSLPGLTIVR